MYNKTRNFAAILVRFRKELFLFVSLCRAHDCSLCERFRAYAMPPRFCDLPVSTRRFDIPQPREKLAIVLGELRRSQ